MANISSATSGNWRADDADTWGLGAGVYPAAGDLVTILSGHNVTLGEDNLAGAVVINSGGTLTGGGFKLTLNDNAGTTFIFSNVGTISGDLDIDITGGSVDRPINEAGTGSIRNLLINNAQTYNLHYHLSLSGNLTITAGTLTTVNSGGTNNSLTVGTNTDDGGATGHLLILDDGELVCNSSTVIVGSVYCQIAAGSNGTGFSELNLPDSSGSFTVRGPEKNGYVFRLDNQAECNHNSGTVTFSLTAENHPSIMDVTSLRGTGVNNILVTQTVSSASSGGVLEFVGNDTVKGNLTLTGNGSQSCLVDTNYNGAGLTVDGDVTVNNHSTFIKRTTNTGNYSFGSLTINSGGTFNATSGTTTITNKASSNFAFKNSGTFTHNSGTMQIGDGSTSTGGAHIMNTTYHNLIINRDQNAPDGNTPWRPSSGTEVTIAGDLTVTKGRFYRNNSSNSLVVTGDVDIAANGQVGTEAASGSNTFGSLTIASGGKYLATSGTTTITSETSGGFAIDNDGTFTHNKGTVKIDHDNSTNLDILGTSGTDLYNLIVDSDATVGYNTSVIENNLTKLGSGLMRPTGDSGRNLTVKGTLLVQAGSFGRGPNDTNTNTFGNIVVEGGELILTGGGGSGKTIVNGSFRNVGGTITSH